MSTEAYEGGLLYVFVSRDWGKQRETT